MTSTATATIHGSPHERSERDCGGSRNRCNTTYYCSFHYVFPSQTGGEARGEDEETGHCGEQQADGAQRTVFFDPDDAAQSTVSDPNSGLNKHGWLIAFIIGLVSLAVGVGSIKFNRWLATPTPPRGQPNEDKLAAGGHDD